MPKRTDAERADMYRRQLGGMTAARNRDKQRAKDYETLLRDWSRWHSIRVTDRESAHVKGKLYDSIAERMRKFGLEAE